MQKVQEFRIAPWGIGVKLMTVVAIAILIVVAISLINFSPLISVLLPAIIVVAYLYAPQKYLLTDSKIIIKRLFSLHIPYKDITAVEAVERLNWRGLRLFGIGGLFGYIGIFLIRDADGVYKTSKLYITRRDHIVRIRTDSSIYYLSPAEPEIFIQALKSRLAR